MSTLRLGRIMMVMMRTKDDNLYGLQYVDTLDFIFIFEQQITLRLTQQMLYKKKEGLGRDWWMSIHIIVL